MSPPNVTDTNPFAVGPATEIRTAGSEESRLFLLVVGEGIHHTYPLPAGGTVVLGRAADADLQIDDPSMSRTHARLSLGAPLSIEDLGSANGTFTREGRLPPNKPVPLLINEAVQLGAVTVILQHRPSQRRARQMRTHDYFAIRIDDECARASRSNATFSLLQLVVAAELEASVISTLATHLRDADVVAAYGPGELEVLLVDANTAATDVILARVTRSFSEQNLAVAVGVAHHPADGRDAEALISVARERARGNDALPPGSRGEVVVVEDHMRSLHALVARVAAADISVLLLGETGVGKEVIAEMIHLRSTRNNGPFVRLNCAALTETLLESELFGHEKGAFTGATQSKPGLLEVAEGGVIFLDEVGELQLSTQAKLLRVIDERKVLRVGAVKPKPIDVRIVSATNRDLEVEVHRNAFRLDLFYRLNAMSIVIPPLRERVGEIVPLATHFLRQFSQRMQRPMPRISAEAADMLQRYPWPGNVRELRNIVERALVLCTGKEITAKELPSERMTSVFTSPTSSTHRVAPQPSPHAPSHAPEDLEIETVMMPHGSSAPMSPRSATPPLSFPAAFPTASRATQPIPVPGIPGRDSSPNAGGTMTPRDDYARIVAALEANNGNQTLAARQLNVSRRTLITWIEKHGIGRPRKR